MGSSLVCRFNVADTGEQMLLERTRRHETFYVPISPQPQPTNCATDLVYTLNVSTRGSFIDAKPVQQDYT